jgi:hypothetical protein
MYKERKLLWFSKFSSKTDFLLGLLTLIRAARGIFDFRNFKQVLLRNGLSNAQC